MRTMKDLDELNGPLVEFININVHIFLGRSEF